MPNQKYHSKPTWLPVLLLAFILSGCASQSDPDSAIATEYDSDSWKTLIDDECRSFFDGCNTCQREPGKQGMCTLKACEVYQKPRCLDDEAARAPLLLPDGDPAG